MRFGLQVNPYSAGPTGNPWDAVAAVARAADESDFDSLWLYDHFLYEGGYSAHPYPEPVLECFTTLSAIAAITRRIRLGQLVLGVPYRNPALVAKMATTLDLISHGRSILGLGAGWHRREYEAYGWGQFEEIGERMKRLEEALQVIHKLWTERPATFAGRYYRLDQVKDSPAPLQQPHPPILIGGSGERVTLRLVARYAQWCNVAGDPATVAHRLDILRAHCDRLGRPYGEITRSNFTTVVVGRDEAEVAAKRDRLRDFIPGSGILVGTPEQLVEIYREYARAGVQYAIFRMPDWADVEPVQLFAERVIPALATV
ncbi:MAG: TIGR03560 family F420-dependent LLM class oxidoreductase [Chloroflexi bacterium]|nr:TIGR03560 family F420-dependent LLM class oxidoreductase [Chloroflexota bacterium]